MAALQGIRRVSCGLRQYGPVDVAGDPSKAQELRDKSARFREGVSRLKKSGSDRRFSRRRRSHAIGAARLPQTEVAMP
jgi:hypothetical protein